MEIRVEQLLSDRGENYIFPFFWQHGEEEAVLREYMDVIQSCGIQAVCVECRPHPDFIGPKWWQDFDIIMDEARNRGMKVWLLDDAHFPTGYANGVVKDADPELCKQYLSFNYVDVVGPTPQVVIDIAPLARYTPNPLSDGAAAMLLQGAEQRRFDDDTLLAVIAINIVKQNKLGDEIYDLTDMVENGQVVWDAPYGMWRIFVLYNTRNGGGRTDYINVLDRDSCRLLIDAVYEPHFERYQDDFGKTFVGFFSDEPLFGNTVGFAMDESIGKKDMPLPWNRDVPEMLRERLGDNWTSVLPALWRDFSDNDLNAKVRYAYMDTVTRLVEENFSKQIGEWCADRGVEYIGHMIEDNNQHSRLGCSLGHFFRGQTGQHMAGIDNIGAQVLLGGENHTRKGFMTPGDGEFYHFTLGKLASSGAHIDPKKMGRAMCETFGAYGWSCGVRLMKYLTDHLLVRGVNHFVPHAFSPKEFPDPDCPPHFYAHGKNPQFRHFRRLMRYMNRACHLINGGKHIAQAALLYHGEAEWTGGHMFLQKPARELMENQIDFDILPSDLFADMDTSGASFDGDLHVNGETYKTLIVPYAEFITKGVARFVVQATKLGFSVIFVDGLPTGICDSDDQNESASLLKDISECKVVALSELARYVESCGFKEVFLSTSFKRLRYYHYKLENDIYFFSNEDQSIAFEGEITVTVKGDAVIYDAFDNVLRPVEYEPVENGTKLKLTVEPYNMVIVVFGDTGAGFELVPQPRAEGEKVTISGEWTMSFAESEEYPNFRDEQKITKLENVGIKYPEFSGTIRYETAFEVGNLERATLNIEEAYEGVEVWVNSNYAGMKVAPPYRFDISNHLVNGSNDLRIEVTNTLERKVRVMNIDAGMYSVFMGGSVLGPSGLIGEVSVYCK
jgi:hypothetical protein